MLDFRLGLDVQGPKPERERIFDILCSRVTFQNLETFLWKNKERNRNEELLPVPNRSKLILSKNLMKFVINFT